MHEVRRFFWDEPYLFMTYMKRMICRYIPEMEMISIHGAFHAVPIRGHHGGTRISHKILQCGYYWLTVYKDAHDFALAYDQCQCHKNISRHHELYLTPNYKLELFDVWGIDFMNPLVSSYGMKYILVVVEYVSKWMELVALPNNKGRSVISF